MFSIYRLVSALDLRPIQGASADSAHLQAIVNTVLSVTGAIAVLIIVVAGFKYITSQGNPNEVTVARNAIIYALIGLIVIIAAFAIVNFVVLGLG
jgi:hypothetical protein